MKSIMWSDVAKQLAKDLGVKVEFDLLKALGWCDIAIMLRIQIERQEIRYFPSIREYTMMYGLNKQILDSLLHRRHRDRDL